MPIPHAVPWRDWEEWKQVKYDIYSPHPILQWNAVLRIEAWKSRGRLPHSISSTAALIRNQLV